MEAVTSVTQKLNEIVHPVDDEEVAVIVLCGLPDLIVPLIIVSYKDELTSEDVRTRLSIGGPKQRWTVHPVAAIQRS
jgi:hypothetical protein